jgi:NAD(P)-dependent dehydrogenase (short-subunit alcohol dehydrogenase family)
MAANSLINKTALITGASRGLGEAIAREFWDAGANLFLVARSARALAELVDSLPRREGQNALFLVIDLSQVDAAQKIHQGIKTKSDHLDILVNNAAILGPVGPLWMNNMQTWRETLQVDLLTPVELIKLTLPDMIHQGSGKIINLSGGGAASPRPFFSAYAAAKSALVRFSETIAIEVLTNGIEINCIAPGVMNTEMMTGILEAGENLAGTKEFQIAHKVSNEGGTSPKTAAKLAHFLASPDSHGITGKLISAVWDPWEEFQDHLEEIQKTDIYTLRRIVPKERGMDWGQS